MEGDMIEIDMEEKERFLFFLGGGGQPLGIQQVYKGERGMGPRSGEP